MKIINIYIIILILVISVILNIDYINIFIADLFYLFNQLLFYKKKINENLAIENISSIKNNINNIKMIILSFDNRKTIDYIEDHNKNVQEYCKKWKNIEYEFTTIFNKNVYWNKIYLVLQKLLTNQYDYVMWMDTDSLFVNFDIDIRNILLLFKSDIYLSHDNDCVINCNNVLNTGVFIIKKSKVGINFLKEAINYFENSKCLNADSKLNGIYAGRCYEQGFINELIYNNYNKYTTILSNEIIFNSFICSDKSFILHNYGGDTVNTDVKSCFNKINSKLNI
jgi:hypothetical protein